jgi:hypothetical protein
MSAVAEKTLAIGDSSVDIDFFISATSVAMVWLVCLSFYAQDQYLLFLITDNHP